MLDTLIIGLDPGPTPGMFLLHVKDSTVNGCATVPKLDPATVPSWIAHADMVAVERFIVGKGTARKTRGGSSEALSQAVAWYDAAKADGKPVQYLPAGQVKPWATDDKLERYGLLDSFVGTRHDKDAARHALFMAVQRGLLPALAK